MTEINAYNYFQTIDTKHKAYLFGLALNNFNFINNTTTYYSITQLDIDNITQYRKYILETPDIILPIIDESLIKYFIYSYIDSIYEYFVDELNIKKLCINIINNYSNIKISLYVIDIIKSINIPFNKLLYKNNTLIIFENINIIDFLGHVLSIYTDLWPDIKINSNLYITYSNLIKINKFIIYKNDPNAIIPFKNKQSDVGYDLTIIKEHKKLNSNTTMYDTGICIQPEFGYYTIVVPRSSLSKSGYMLKNSIGIIDPSYIGNIYIVLIKTNPDAPDIELPFKCCQLIVQKQIYSELIETDTPFTYTSRGIGGFGSTNIN
jgi:deoxyuridine 5'-triphosphate nucleotidohydrolase